MAEDQRLTHFLEASRIAVVATLNRDGSPQLTPNWYVYDGGRLAISTTKERLKHRNLLRDPRMSVCICSEPMAHEYAVIKGNVEIDDTDAIWPITRKIVERYVAPDGVEARLEMLRQENRVVLYLQPERVAYHQMSLPPGSR